MISHSVIRIKMNTDKKIKLQITKKHTQPLKRILSEDGTDNAETLLNTIITKYIDDNKITLLDIINKECPTDTKLQTQLIQSYMKLIVKRLNLGDIIKSDINKGLDEKKINGLIKWEYLREYQIEYINTVINILLRDHKCIMKSPTGSGKTNMFFWVIVKLFETLKQSKFNILLLTPRIKLCNQSINESYRNILEYNKIKCHFYNYDYENKFYTESKIKDNLKNNTSNNNFISSTYQSMPNIIDFIKKINLVFDLVIFDEFHYIVSWGNKDNKITLLNYEYFKNKLYTSATPYKIQEDNYTLYGKLVEKVSVKQLIDQSYLCPIIPLVEIDNDELLTKEEKEVKRKLGKYFKLPLLIADTFSRYSKKKAILFCNDTANCWEIYELLQNNMDILKITKQVSDNNTNSSKYIKVFQPYVSIGKHRSIKVFANESDFTEDNEIIKTDIDNIEETLKKYEDCNEPCILITCKKIDMGYDHPPIDLVIIADNKASLVDISQSIGRGLRTINGENKACHVLLPIKVKDINNNNYNSVKSYLEYLQNNVGINIEYFIREQIKNQRQNIIKKFSKEDKIENNITENQEFEDNTEIDNNVELKESELEEKYDNKELYNKMRFIYDNWVKIYDSLTILPTGSNKHNFEYNMLCDNIRFLHIKDKDEYKKWARDNNEEINPEIKYNLYGWHNYYQFLNIDISNYPKTIDELKNICIKENIKSKDDYIQNIARLNLPRMPEELYKKKIRGSKQMCRETALCFTDGQKIKHTIKSVGKTQIGIYNAKKNLIEYNGAALTMNMFVKNHYKKERPDRDASANAWLECMCEIDGKWVSTYNLPENNNDFYKFLN